MFYSNCRGTWPALAAMVNVTLVDMPARSQRLERLFEDTELGKPS